jgi:hypothetical protein
MEQAAVQSQNIWTAIIPLNEEYYIAFNEDKAHPFLLTSLKSRKSQQDGFPTLQPSKPWEKYTSQTITSLYLDFNHEEPSHHAFTLQEQTERDRARGLKAVFIDTLTLIISWKGLQFDVCFVLKQTPKFSETRKVIQEHLRNLRDRHGLYSDISKSKKDRTFFERVFQRPSCLEISEVHQVGSIYPNSKLSDGKDEESIQFLCNLVPQTHNLVWDAYKKFDTKSGLILDGIVPSRLIEERLREVT